MKILSENQMLQICDTLPECFDIAIQNLLPVFSATDDNVSWLKYGVKEGFLKTSQINLDGKPIAVLFWNKVFPQRLEIVCAVAIDLSEKHIMEIAAGSEMVARSEGCQALSFSTRRPAMLKILNEAGFRSTGVNLVKIL